MAGQQGTRSAGTEDLSILSCRRAGVRSRRFVLPLAPSDCLYTRDDALVQFEFEEIKAALDFDRSIVSNIGWKSFLTKPGNRKRMRIIIAIAFFSQWSGNGLVSYYLNKVFDAIGITDPMTQLLINGVLQIWNLAVAMTASFFADRLGRRFLFLTSCVGMLVFWTAQTVTFELSTRGNVPASHAVIAFIFLFYLAYKFVVQSFFLDNCR